MRRSVLTLCLPLVLAVVAQTGDAAAPPAKAPPPPAMPKTLSELRILEEKIQVTIKKIVPATVGVGNGGSGVVVSKDGLVVSVAHVTQKAGREIQITFPDGKKAKGKTLGNFGQADASLVQITDKGPFPFVDMAKGSDVRAGQWCLAVGYPVSFPRGQRPPVRIGRVLRMSETQVTTDCPIMGGDSGGPLFDLEGRVIGVNSLVTGSMLGNVHVHIGVYHKNWKKLNDGEDWGAKGNTKGKSEAAIPLPELDSTLLKQRAGKRQPELERNYDVIREAFREAVEPASKSTVRILIDGKPSMLGTVVNADGLVVTKATALGSGKITCKLPDGKVVEAKAVGEDKEHDLALLEVAAKGLTPVKWAKETPIQGNLVAAPGEDGKALAIGMVTSEPRQFKVASRPAGAVDLKRAYLGINGGDADDSGGARVDLVRPGTPAERAGLKPGDVITQVGTATIKKTEHLTQAMKLYQPTQKVDVVVKRGDKTETLGVTLAKPPADFNQGQQPYDKWGGGPFSEKRFGFPKVLPHDMVLRPMDCGGPLVDTSGRVVGLNVSRSLRISTYALMPADVERVVAKLDEAHKADRTKKAEKTTSSEKAEKTTGKDDGKK